MNKSLTSLLLVVAAATTLTSSAWAEPNRCAVVTRETVVPCALRTSAAVRGEREGMLAAAGRRTAAAPWFPSNPELAVSLARRSGTEGHGDVLNYSATLSQELEVAGQRASSRRAADSDVDAHAQDTAATARRAAGEALAAYFDLLAAREALDLARRLETTTQLIAQVTRGRAGAGVASPLDAEVADAASLRVTQGRFDAERELRARSARLTSLLGGDPVRESVSVSGALEPLRDADALLRSTSSERAAERPEVKALDFERRAHEARAEAFRRGRIPTLTLQLFAQNDGYNERVFGAGLSVPIPLPQPVGHLRIGEIREAEALARQAQARSDTLTRAFGAELAVALANYESLRDEATLFTKDRVDRSERLLSEIGKEIEAGRLSVRDAIVAQQELIEVLRGSLETRRSLCLASVALALAAGAPLDGAAK